MNRKFLFIAIRYLFENNTMVSQLEFKNPKQLRSVYKNTDFSIDDGLLQLCVNEEETK